MHDLTPEIKHLRKLLVAELTSATRLEASKRVRAEEIAFMLRAIARETGPFEMVAYTKLLSTNLLTHMVLCRRFMGGEERSGRPEMVAETKEFVDMVNEILACFSAVHPRDFFNVPEWFDPQRLDARFRRARARIDAFYANIVRQHGGTERTLLDALLAQLENPDFDYTEDHVKFFVWDALSAGLDSIGVTTEWAMAEVLRNPRVARAARAELDRVVGRARTVQESDIPKLGYIQAILKESLRLHPPTPFLIPHQSIHATTAFGFDILGRTRLFVNAWAIGRDPDSWEMPTQFVPERFLPGGAHATAQFQGQHFELIPFGTGRRLCPGMAFAATAVHLQVASLLHAFDLSFPDGMAPEDLDMAEAPGLGLTLGKLHRLVVVATPRLPSHLY